MRDDGGLEVLRPGPIEISQSTPSIGGDIEAPGQLGSHYAPGKPVRDASVPLAELYRTFGGTRKELAAYLGLSERTLYRWVQQAG